LNLKEVIVRPVHKLEEKRYQCLMEAYHYLGSMPKISETLWYIANLCNEWVALISFSAAALKCLVLPDFVVRLSTFAGTQQRYDRHSHCSGAS
jgi:hypothetical protein